MPRYCVAQDSTQAFASASASAAAAKVSSTLDHFSDTLSTLRDVPSRYFKQVTKSADHFNQRLSKASLKSLRLLQRQEERINRRLSKIDSVAAHNLFSNSIDSLSHLQDKVKSKVSSLADRIPGKQYIPFLDTLQTSLKFLDKYSSKLNQVSGAEQKLQSSLSSVQQLEGRLQQVDNIQQYINQQQDMLKESLSSYGDLFNKYLSKFGRDAYYYKAEIENYKDIWQHPDQVEAKAV